MNIENVKENIISAQAAADQTVMSILYAISDSIIARTAANSRVVESKFWIVDAISELVDSCNIALFVDEIPIAEYTFDGTNDGIVLASDLFTKLSEFQAYYKETARQNDRYGIRWTHAGKTYMLLYSDSNRNFQQ